MVLVHLVEAWNLKFKKSKSEQSGEGDRLSSGFKHDTDKTRPPAHMVGMFC